MRLQNRQLPFVLGYAFGSVFEKTALNGRPVLFSRDFFKNNPKPYRHYFDGADLPRIVSSLRAKIVRFLRGNPVGFQTAYKRVGGEIAAISPCSRKSKSRNDEKYEIATRIRYANSLAMTEKNLEIA